MILFIKCFVKYTVHNLQKFIHRKIKYLDLDATLLQSAYVFKICVAVVGVA